MRVMILGGSGMLGHRLWIRLQNSHETWVTVRGHETPFPDRPEFPRDHICTDVDALVFDEVVRALSAIQPDVVINCIGLIKQTPQANDPLSAIRVNAMLPHQLALVCASARIRMIHVSTDCVFSGRKGGYTEDDPSDAVDLYGRTKFLGEVGYPRTVTLRTSIIGRELKSRLGLVEWFLAQKGEVQGYTRAIFSGVTTDELARVIRDFVLPDASLSGIMHVSADPISKHDLLVLVRDMLHHQVRIIPQDQFVIDRSLDSRRFRSRTGYQPQSWPEMVEVMAKDASLYECSTGT